MTDSVAAMSQEVVHEVHKPVHDAPTLIAYFSLASWSWFVYGFGASLALLAVDQGAEAWLVGLHAPALALGGVLGAVATPRLTHRFGRGVMMRAAAIGTALSILTGSIASTAPASMAWAYFGVHRITASPKTATRPSVHR